MKAIILSSFLCLLVTLSLSAQNFVWEERSLPTTYYYNYLQQPNLVEISLREGRIHPMLMLSDKYKLADSEFKKLSEIFTAHYPKDFHTPEKPPAWIGKDASGSSTFYKKLTYATIGKDNKITTYLQLIVIFDVDTSSEETLKNPTISKIEVLQGNAIGKLDTNEVLKSYEEHLASAGKGFTDIPPPPPVSKQ
jgi:hypothetical protein